MQIEFLNGLRGICALWVVAIHELMIFLPMGLSYDEVLRHLGGRWEWILAKLPISEGNFAVCLFFLLSAFVMSIRYWQQEQRKNDCLINAAVRRYIRLTGPVLGAMLIAWLLMEAGWMRNLAVSEITLTHMIMGGNGAYVFQTPMSIWDFLRNAFYEVYIAGSPSSGRQFDFVLWTMPIELAGSLMALGGLAVLGNVHKRDIFYAMLCLFAGSSYILAFPLGVWLCDIRYASDREKARKFLGSLKWLPYLCMVLGLYLGISHDAPGNPIYDWFREPTAWQVADRPALYHTVGGALFLYAVLELGWLQRLLDSRPLVFLGHHSFSLYLAHVPVYCSLQSALFMHFFRHGHGYGSSLLISFFLSLPAIALVTWIIDRFFDRQAQKLARRFAGWLLKDG